MSPPAADTEAPLLPKHAEWELQSTFGVPLAVAVTTLIVAFSLVTEFEFKVRVLAQGVVTGVVP